MLGLIKGARNTSDQGLCEIHDVLEARGRFLALKKWEKQSKRVYWDCSEMSEVQPAALKAHQPQGYRCEKNVMVHPTRIVSQMDRRVERIHSGETRSISPLRV